MDSFLNGADKEEKRIRTNVLKNGLIFDPKKYEYKEDWVPAKAGNVMEVHSTQEMIEELRRDKKIQLEARVLGMTKDGHAFTKMNRDQFLEATKKRDSKKLREAIDSFQTDDYSTSYVGSSDFTPLLGGPFNKQLYYADYLRMIATCFYAKNHDPTAKTVTSIMSDFTLGRGFQLHAADKAAQMLWDMFIEVNDFYRQFEYCSEEMSTYGETMWWWLPNNNARISFNPVAGETIPKAIIPRIRLLDPSNMAEIITVPEDMVQGVLAYVWLAPTQYNMWTRDNQPSAKFIYTQIPANQIIHEKVNSVSNEKRGRSDFFSALGYMKRLRDGVDYSLIAQLKASAWCIDTTVDGDDSDYQTYLDQQAGLGAIPEAGSEFVHTKAIERKYLSNTAAKSSSDSPVFEWCLNMIAMSSGIPVSYLGTQLKGSSGSRAGALVATEPVVKKFERRQLAYRRMIEKIFKQLCAKFNVKNTDCEIIFPELLSQDRSSLLKDLTLAQSNSWLAHSRCAEIAAKEFEIKDFDAEAELVQIKKEDAELGISPAQTSPLTAPPKTSQTQTRGGGVSSDERKDVRTQLTTL